MDGTGQLASYRRCNERICTGWEAFQQLRAQRLAEQQRFGHAAERATESIVEDLLTHVLDWTPGDLNHQVGYADLLLTRLGIKHLIVETKRPGALAWSRHAVEGALEQACRYAAEQKVRCVAISDGHMFYAADIEHGGLQDRVFCSLHASEPPEELWWLSIDGIYRQRSDSAGAALRLLAEPSSPEPDDRSGQAAVLLLHPKYKLPARCFAYAADPADTRTWHLPYLCADGSVDTRRLPGAIGAILRNYRGAHVTSIPEPAIPDVLRRLADAARRAGKMPGQSARPAEAYLELACALEQIGDGGPGEIG